MFSRATFVLIASLAMSACNLLDTNPPDQLSDVNAIKTPAGARTALAAAYGALQSGYYYGGTMTHFGDLYADNARHVGTFTSYQDAASHTFFADNGDVTGMWNALYEAIKRANDLLDKVPLVEGFEEGEQEEILGEAYFLRALSYHNLVKYYGGVPLQLVPVKDPADAGQLPRATVVETYDQIVADLTQAEALVTSTAPNNHATIGAVKALLARVLFFRGQWALAIAKANEVTGYSLGSYEALFNNDAANTSEVIFKVTFTAQIEQANLLGYYWLSDQLDDGAGRFEIGPTQSLINSYDTLTTDTRLLWNIQPDPGGDGYIEASQGGGSYGTKFPTPNGAEDFHVLRFAEMILTKAESFAQLGQLDSAVANINLTRARASLPALVLGGTVPNTQAGVINAVREERRKEFAEEGDRFPDLSRDPAYATPLLNNIPANRLVFPIPQSEIDLSPLVVQNPGY